MEMPLNQLNENTKEVAVVQARVDGIDEKVSRLETGLEKNSEMVNTIMTNHLPHLAVDIQEVKSAIRESAAKSMADIERINGHFSTLTEKISPVVKAVYAVIGLVLTTVVAGLISIVLKH